MTPTDRGDSASGEHRRRPLLGLVLNADRVIRSFMDETLQEFSLPTPEYTCLVIIRNYGPMSSAELARRVFVTPQAMGYIIASVEQRGLVVRHPDPSHGRKLLARLTPDGVALVDACVDRLKEVEQRFLGALNPREQRYFIEMFTACVDHLNAQRNEA
jgi:DNA-binding MarR family transcriptional regulator